MRHARNQRGLLLLLQFGSNQPSSPCVSRTKSTSMMSSPLAIDPPAAHSLPPSYATSALVHKQRLSAEGQRLHRQQQHGASPSSQAARVNSLTPGQSGMSVGTSEDRRAGGRPIVTRAPAAASLPVLMERLPHSESQEWESHERKRCVLGSTRAKNRRWVQKGEPTVAPPLHSCLLTARCTSCQRYTVLRPRRRRTASRQPRVPARRSPLQRHRGRPSAGFRPRRRPAGGRRRRRAASSAG